MTIEEFKQSLNQKAAPNLPLPLQAMWHDAKGDWDRAHDLLQDDSTQYGAWVHAYLHRKEGDLANASYWYSRARKEPAHGSLEQEWDVIVEELLNDNIDQ